MIKKMRKRSQYLPPISLYIPEEEKEIIVKLEEIRWKEHLNLSELIRKAIKEYIEKHAEGNPAFTIDQFVEPGMKATPAFMSLYEKWKTHFLTESTEKDLEEYKRQIMTIDKAFSDAISIKRKIK